MHTLYLLSSVLAVLAGMVTLAIGNWNRFKLKHFVVFLSTGTMFWMTLNMIVNNKLAICVAGEEICAQWMIMGISKNIILILFYLAVGRDAYYFKNKDRRGAYDAFRHRHQSSTGSLHAGRVARGH